MLRSTEADRPADAGLDPVGGAEAFVEEACSLPQIEGGTRAAYALGVDVMATLAPDGRLLRVGAGPDEVLGRAPARLHGETG